ncbi:hypothetical protein ASPCADRAFT_208020 [Aspergillus carbonarius ITEM 5010]|uniref:Uncharacterized protein n=1 Tax=Aspergillus carbonarius (strain ITEM 5010) TaxID=602072 RepID=A0A1R3RM67_ASPC5|nr:hypothetical protein ASPCADRAFT_208020 [Aspergillus carbonarius ITEM 5010]
MHTRTRGAAHLLAGDNGNDARPFRIAMASFIGFARLARIIRVEDPISGPRPRPLNLRLALEYWYFSNQILLCEHATFGISEGIAGTEG